MKMLRTALKKSATLREKECKRHRVELSSTRQQPEQKRIEHGGKGGREEDRERRQVRMMRPFMFGLVPTTTGP